MDNKNKTNTAIILLLVVSLIFAIVQNNKINYLEDRLFSLENNITNNMRNEIYNLTHHIDNMLSRSESIVDTYSIAYDGIDTVQKTANVILNFTLKESMQNTKVQIAASYAEGSEVIANFDAETGNRIDYVAKFPLSYMQDYVFDIYETGENGFARKLNTNQTISLYLKGEMEDRTVLGSFGTGIGTEDVSANFEIINKTFGEDGFQMEKVEFVISFDGKELYRRDVTNQSLSNIEDIARYNLQVASGEINPSEKFNYEYKEAQMDPTGVEHGYYHIESIPHEHLLGKKIEGEPPAYNFTVEVTYKNGEKKVFNN